MREKCPECGIDVESEYPSLGGMTRYKCGAVLYPVSGTMTQTPTCELRCARKRIAEIEQKLKHAQARIAVLAKHTAVVPQPSEFHDAIHELNMAEEQSGLYRSQEQEHIAELECDLMKSRGAWQMMKNSADFRKARAERTEAINAKLRDALTKIAHTSENAMEGAGMPEFAIYDDITFTAKAALSKDGK